MKLYANLHTHSTHSDGAFSPAEMAQAAKKEGYGAIAITDHDTATAYPELKAECDKLGIETIFGVEFSSPSPLLKGLTGDPSTFHICGYHFDRNHPKMKEYLDGMSFRETDQTYQLFKRGIKLGMLHDVEWEEVLEFNKGITWLCNEHLWRLLLHKGLMKKEDRQWYFRELFGVHRDEIPPAYAFKQADEIIKLIHDAGGIAVVAHPHLQLEFMPNLIEMGIDGLEVWHPDLTEEEKEKALKIGLENNLYISGGSDHSGICSGYYQYYKDPKTEFRGYAEPLTYGTTKEYFDEIKNCKLNR